MEIFVLKEEKYQATKQSLGLPVLSDEILTEFLNKLEQKDQFEILLEFEDWLKSQK